jgi:hypothetical protein
LGEKGMKLEKKCIKKNVNYFLTMNLTPKKKDMGKVQLSCTCNTNKQMPQIKRVVPSPNRQGKQLQEVQFSGGNEK